MASLADFLRDMLARLRGAQKPKPAPQQPCKFCGQAGHTAEDCPNAAKFHVFSVDHDAEDDK